MSVNIERFRFRGHKAEKFVEIQEECLEHKATSNFMIEVYAVEETNPKQTRSTKRRVALVF
jgi:menaquinone-dependent protoporphyrinogen IX oxidase